MLVSAKVKHSDMRARVYRQATGEWEDLGVIASTRFFMGLWIKIKKLFK